MNRIGRIGSLLVRIYRLKYIAFNLLVFIAYYTAINYLLRIQAQGIAFAAVPAAYIYALSLASSLLMTIAVYSAFNSRNNRARYGATAGSAATALAGGLVAGCGCQGTILYGAFAVALGSGSATLLNSIVADHVNLVFSAFIAVNVALVAYYLARLSSPRCTVKRRVRD
jgi:hypothetical protein